MHVRKQANPIEMEMIHFPREETQSRRYINGFVSTQPMVVASRAPYKEIFMCFFPPSSTSHDVKFVERALLHQSALCR